MAINHKSIKMKTITLTKFRQVLIFILTLVALALMTMFCSCKKSTEKTQEKIMEASIGENAKVDLDDEKIVIKTDEGTFTSDATAKSWPNEIPSDVPKFKDGKVVNVSTQNVDDSSNWTVLFENVSDNALNDYETALKKNGFKVSTISMGDTKGHITAEKDELLVVVMGGEGMASFSVGVKK